MKSCKSDDKVKVNGIIMENFEKLSWWSIVDVQGVFGCFLKWGKEGGMGEASIYSESEL